MTLTEDTPIVWRCAYCQSSGGNYAHRPSCASCGTARAPPTGLNRVYDAGRQADVC
jgi:hypothetical protein